MTGRCCVDLAVSVQLSFVLVVERLLTIEVLKSKEVDVFSNKSRISHQSVESIFDVAGPTVRTVPVGSRLGEAKRDVVIVARLFSYD
jgi:hypothetical protein